MVLVPKIVRGKIGGFEHKNLVYVFEKIKSAMSVNENKAKELRAFYYQGSSYGKSGLNKLWGEINSIASLIFTPEHLLIEMKVENQENLSQEVEELLERLKEKLIYNFYTMNRLDIVMENAVKDALKYGYTPVKVYWKDEGVKVKQIAPENFAVAYESLPIDDIQQIILHKTYLTKEMIEFRYGIDVKVMELAEAEMKKSTKGELFVTAIDKSVADLTTPALIDYEPKNVLKLYPLYELWINEYPYTGKDCWNKFELLEQYKDLVVKHERWVQLRHPFFLLVPYPIENSVYGISLIDLVKEIQEKRTERTQEISQIVSRIAKPPILIRGAQVSKEQVAEDIRQLYSENGFLVIADPQADMKPIVLGADMINALYDEILFYDQQIRYITGLHEIIVGERAAGTRATGMASMLAQFASAPFRVIANKIASYIEEVFFHMAKLYQFNDDTFYEIGNKKFRFIDIPENFRIEVQTYSVSPIMQKEHLKIAFELVNAGLIPPELLIDLTGLPNADKIKIWIKRKEKEAALRAALTPKEKGGEESGS